MPYSLAVSLRDAGMAPERAVVLRASMGGLLAARMPADSFRTLDMRSRQHHSQSRRAVVAERARSTTG
jgi:hypothetical protein